MTTPATGDAMNKTKARVLHVFDDGPFKLRIVFGALHPDNFVLEVMNKNAMDEESWKRADEHVHADALLKLLGSSYMKDNL